MEKAIARRETDTYYLDLLTQHDLMMLKARKQGQQYTKPDEPADPTGKRYLILTITNVDQDKVHFPMPLNYLEDPGIEVLRRTLTRMQSAVQLSNKQDAWSEQSPSGSKSMNTLGQLEQENLFLK